METLLNPGLLLQTGEEATRIFGIKLFDEDFWELLFRLTLSFAVNFAIVRYMYRPTKPDDNYLFTYVVFNPLIFFICHLFSKVDLSIGFAFGLFAVFSILRYRTTTIQIKEMTYMFIVIAVAVINALATKKVSYAELLFTNLFVLGLIYLLERYIFTSESVLEEVIYEDITHVHPSNREILINNLKERTGLEVTKYDIVRLDYLRDVAILKVYYKS